MPSGAVETQNDGYDGVLFGWKAWEFPRQVDRVLLFFGGGGRFL